MTSMLVSIGDMVESTSRYMVNTFYFVENLGPSHMNSVDQAYLVTRANFVGAHVRNFSSVDLDYIRKSKPKWHKNVVSLRTIVALSTLVTLVTKIIRIPLK